MCGIAGYFRPAGLAAEPAAAILDRMTATLRHRGPDDGGSWIDAAAGIALGSRRLAILDLSPLGHQPMHAASGRYVIVFNGEVYNFRALRGELEALGHRFRGHSDTEVLLGAVSEWGVRPAVERLNGMYAFALWDRLERTLHLVRDRPGEKPLYYAPVGDTLLFGSELKALRAHPAFPAEIDRDALALLLRYRCVPAPYTIYRGVYKLPPATILSLPARATNWRDSVPIEYWSARAVAERGVADPFTGSERDAVDCLDELLRDAVRLRMEADVPLGAFLSGGTDSSLVVALMQAQSPRPVRTFTIGFHEWRYNEAPHAAAVARHLGTDHTELYVTPAEALAVVPRLPVIYDEPFADPSQIPTFLISELTRRHVTVSLSGDAGDELFGGYRRYHLGPALWGAMRWLPAGARRGMAAGLTRVHRAAAFPGSALRRWTGKRNLRERVLQVAEVLRTDSPTALLRYLISAWKDPTGVVPGAHEPPTLLSSHSGQIAPDVARQIMYLDLVTYLPDDILVKVDRASMAVSLESRIPLLDHRIIEFAWRLPPSLKIRDGRGKWLLRELLARYVPRSVTDRPKHGFDVPLGAWLRGPLRGWAEELLDEGRLRREGMLRPEPIRQKWLEHMRGDTSWTYDLWTVLMFQAWLEATPSSSPSPWAPAAGAGAAVPLTS
ncbi:MAG: asparagine synthase (glutamine-hydrolyzing) [Gemmatimonadales bacterium]